MSSTIDFFPPSHITHIQKKIGGENAFHIKEEEK